MRQAAAFRMVVIPDLDGPAPAVPGRYPVEHPHQVGICSVCGDRPRAGGGPPRGSASWPVRARRSSRPAWDGVPWRRARWAGSWDLPIVGMWPPGSRRRRVVARLGGGGGDLSADAEDGHVRADAGDAAVSPRPQGSLVPGRQTSGRWVRLTTDGGGGDEACRAQDRHPAAPTAAPADLAGRHTSASPHVSVATPPEGASPDGRMPVRRCPARAAAAELRRSSRL